MIIKNQEEPFCEHCGELEVGSFVFNDGTTWCLVCANVNGYIDDKELEKLRKDECKSMIKAYEKRIKELEKELKS